MDLTWRQLWRRLTLSRTSRRDDRRPRGSLRLEPLEVRLTPAAPVVSSILRSLPQGTATNAATVAYQVTFSEPVGGVAVADFQLVKTGTVSATLTGVTPVSSSVYTVTVGSISGNGSLGLNLVDNESIRDAVGEALVRPFQAAAFQSATAAGTGTGPFSVTAADLNGDGHTDLVVANLQSNSVSVLLSNGNGTFQPAVNYATDAKPIAVAVADLNGDGHLDLLVANSGGSDVSVLLNHGNGTFAAAVNYPTGAEPIAVAVADLNGDGHLDLVAAAAGTNSVSVLLGNGDGTFQAGVSYAADSQSRSVAIADLNGDGRPDLVVANQGSNDVSVLLGNGDGTFQAVVNYPAGTLPQAIAVADFNSDGLPDLVVANAGSNNVSLLLGNGNGTFQAPVNFSTGSEPRALTVADVNGDGHPDVITANYGSNNVSVLLGNGNATFQPAVNFAAGAKPAGVAVADVSGDGRPDVITANYGGNTASVLLGTGSGSVTGQVYTIDQTAPTLFLTAPANGGTVTTNEPTFSGSAGNATGDVPPITINIYAGSSATGTPVETLTTANGSSYSVTATAPLTGVTYTAQASQSDSAGNIGLSNPTTFTLAVGPAFTSANTEAFAVGIASSFPVTASGAPAPTFTESGALPAGVTFNGATGVLSGTPAAGTDGSYPLTFTAANGVGANATQNFTLTVAATGSAPAFTNLASALFSVGAAETFTLTATGVPTPVLTESGTLPAGVTFNAANGVLSGTPAPGSAGSYPLTFTAANGAGANATQSFTLSVNSPVDELGAYRASNGSWSLDSDDTLGFNIATDQVFYSYSPAGVTGVAGDWTGNGTSKIGDFSNGVWHLDLNGNGVFATGETFQFGQAGDQPVVGDWTGSGVSNIGVFRAAPDGVTGEFILDTNGDHVLDAGDEIFTFGLAGDRIVIGDWNGGGKDEVGVFRDAASYRAADAGDAVFTLDSNNSHAYDPADQVFVYGLISDHLIVGDWNGAGKSEVGVYRDAAAVPAGNPLHAPGTALFSLDSNGDRQYDAGDQVFLYGLSSDQFVSGHWAKTPPLQPEGMAQYAADGPGPGGAALTQAQLAPVLQQALAAWSATGVSVAKLESVPVEIGHLGENLVGWTSGDRITLDATADGWGWNTDPSNADFTTAGADGLQATPGSAAASKMDLLTVVEHELGHELGLGDVNPLTHPYDLMAATLAPGVRRQPT